ncbi:MAG TPA: ATP synthase A1 subunit C [Candidatus Nanoarchaeia archaeon]|nr:ATP synthase A1 subunit C [Candidatus Nanoarchaeia archaeon]
MLRLEGKRKLNLGRYPYTYVRTSVMKSLLFKKEDYQKMMKMGFSEIAKYMQDSNYKKEINELATSHSGSDLLELALNRNLANSYKKLLRISPNTLGMLVKAYVKRKDVEDIKTIIRGKLTNASQAEILNSITEAGLLDHAFLMSLLKKDSIEEVLKANRMIELSAFKDGLKELKEKNSIVAIENAMDKYYYSSLAEFSKTIPKQGNLFRNFIQKEIDAMNMLTLFRLKKAKFNKERIKTFMVSPSGKIKMSKLADLANVEDFGELAKAFSKTEYGNVVSEGIEEYKKTGSLIKLETGLYKHVLRQSMLMLHQHPLSVDVILGYMFAKEIEIRNLKIIIKGKQLGLKEDFIENQLVF